MGGTVGFNNIAEVGLEDDSIVVNDEVDGSKDVSDEGTKEEEVVGTDDDATKRSDEGIPDGLIEE